MYRIRVRRDADLLQEGMMVVRTDLGGGPVRTALDLYQRGLNAYWRLLRRTVLR